MNNPHVGSSSDDLLIEEALLEEVTVVALMRVIAWLVEQEISVSEST